jgi:hypothetical protein
MTCISVDPEGDYACQRKDGHTGRHEYRVNEYVAHRWDDFGSCWTSLTVIPGNLEPVGGGSD